MKNHKKSIIFYICDFILIGYSIIMMFIENANKTTGLAALEGVGHFVLYLIMFCIGIFLFVTVTIVIFIVKKKHK